MRMRRMSALRVSVVPSRGTAGPEFSAPALTISSSASSSSAPFSPSLVPFGFSPPSVGFSASRAVRASRAAVADLVASFHCSSLRWQAAILECRTARGKYARRGKGRRASSYREAALWKSFLVKRAVASALMVCDSSNAACHLVSGRHRRAVHAGDTYRFLLR